MNPAKAYAHLFSPLGGDEAGYVGAVRDSDRIRRDARGVEDDRIVGYIHAVGGEDTYEVGVGGRYAAIDDRGYDRDDISADDRIGKEFSIQSPSTGGVNRVEIPLVTGLIKIVVGEECG